MKPAKNIGKLIQKLHIIPRAEIHQKTLSDIFKAQDNFIKAKSVVDQSNIWRTIMKTKITKFAVVVLIAIAVLLPLSYGATKLYTYIFEEEMNKWTDANNVTHVTTRKISIRGDNITNEKQAKKAHEEMIRLIKEGKAQEVSPGLYKGTLSDGTKFAFAFSGKISDNDKEQK